MTDFLNELSYGTLALHIVDEVCNEFGYLTWRAEFRTPGDDNGENREVIFEMSGYDYDQFRGEGALLEALDEDPFSAPFAALAVEGDGWLNERAEECGGAGSSLVIVERVSLNPKWRGHRAGRYLTARTLSLVARDAQLVALQPEPFELEEDSPERGATRETIRSLWESIGFEDFGESNIMTLDPDYHDFHKEARGFLEKVT